MDKKYYLVLFVIFIIGVFLRFFQIGNNPASLYWDEVAIGLDAYAINATGRDMNNQHWLQPIYPSYGDYKAPVYILLTSLSTRILGLSPLSIRLPIAIFSVLAMLTYYLLIIEILSFENGKKTLTKTKIVTLVSFLLLAVSPWSVHFGRIGLESSLSVFWLLLGVYLFLRTINSNKAWLLIFSVISSAIGVYSYYSLRVIVPLLFFGLGLIFIKFLRKNWLYSIISIILFLILNIPIYKSNHYERSQGYRLNNDNLITATKVITESSHFLERYNSNQFSRLAYHRDWFWIGDFLENYLSHFKMDFLFISGDQNLRHHSGYGGQFFFILFPFYYIGLVNLIKNLKNKSNQIIGIFVLVSPIPAAMVYETPHASRSIYLLVPIIFIISSGVFKSMKYFYKNKSLFFLFAVFFAFNFSFYYLDYFIDYPRRSSKDWIYAYSQVSEYIRDNYQKYSEIDIDGKYWMPELYIYFRFPNLIIDGQKMKEAMINNPINSFGLKNPLEKIIVTKYEKDENGNERLKPKAMFMDPEAEISNEYQLINTFYFLDEEPSINLFVSDMEK